MMKMEMNIKKIVKKKTRVLTDATVMKKNESRLIKIGHVTFTANEWKRGIVESTGDTKLNNSEYNKKFN
eukprot:15326295-Ditylum_brightwellii.AAC.2